MRSKGERAAANRIESLDERERRRQDEKRRRILERVHIGVLKVVESQSFCCATPDSLLRRTPRKLSTIYRLLTTLSKNASVIYNFYR